MNEHEHFVPEEQIHENQGADEAEGIAQESRVNKDRPESEFTNVLVELYRSRPEYETNKTLHAMVELMSTVSVVLDNKDSTIALQAVKEFESQNGIHTDTAQRLETIFELRAAHQEAEAQQELQALEKYLRDLVVAAESMDTESNQPEH